MPFLPIASHISDIQIGLWRIEEPEEYYMQSLNLYENEQRHLAKIIHPQKRLEWLSSRLCLKTLLNIRRKVESLNNSQGKPYLSDNSHFISYSHSTHYAAAVASKNGEVAIDIEMFRKRRSPETAKMFMDEYELAAFENSQNMYLFFLIWSAKETLFKVYGKRGIYFRENIHINIEDFTLKQNGKVSGYVQYENYERYYEIVYEIFSDFILTYTFGGMQQPQVGSLNC